MVLLVGQGGGGILNCWGWLLVVATSRNLAFGGGGVIRRYVVDAGGKVGIGLGWKLEMAELGGTMSYH